jgi:S-adenosylmethionine:tRNA ribosyltransferase-isomerase
MSTPFTFTLPDELSAKEPPERRGLGRDKVRLLVIARDTGAIEHATFERLGEFLRKGDLLVFNSSRTLPASLEACCSHGPCLQVRLAQHLPDDSWLALLVCKAGDPFGCGLRAGMRLEFTEDLTGEVFDRDPRIPRLWKIRFSKTGTELDYYQTVYAKEPGSAEMPSAGRAFTWKSLFELRRHGIDFAYLVLHTGLSSYLDDDLDRSHPASEEEYFLSEAAAEKINTRRERGGRIIAVGTTVVRALESIAKANGHVEPGHDYTRLHIASGHKLKAVEGLLTGLHEPEASHLDLLSAFVSAGKIHAAYNQAIQQRYLWHEFGDLNLII